MYTGTLIEDLVATVERAERHAREQQSQELEAWCAAARNEIAQLESALAGVA